MSLERCPTCGAEGHEKCLAAIDELTATKAERDSLKAQLAEAQAKLSGSVILPEDAATLRFPIFPGATNEQLRDQCNRLTELFCHHEQRADAAEAQLAEAQKLLSAEPSMRIADHRTEEARRVEANKTMIQMGERWAESECARESAEEQLRVAREALLGVVHAEFEAGRGGPLWIEAIEAARAALSAFTPRAESRDPFEGTHNRPDGKECAYLAADFCNKCGWHGAPKAEPPCLCMKGVPLFARADLMRVAEQSYDAGWRGALDASRGAAVIARGFILRHIIEKSVAP